MDKGVTRMVAHQLTKTHRYPGSISSPSLAECKEHEAAGRIPVFRGFRLVAFVDKPEDMPEASFETNRYTGRVVGRVSAR
jgi:hypothetical protein